MAGNRKRVKSFNIPDHAHELTFSCFHGLKLLDRDRGAGLSMRWRLRAPSMASIFWPK
jgi:hypothetical protein